MKQRRVSQNSFDMIGEKLNQLSATLTQLQDSIGRLERRSIAIEQRIQDWYRQIS